MGNTPLSNLPYPEATDTPFVHIDLRNLAEAVDGRLPIVTTSSSRPPHVAGRIIYEVDTRSLWVSNGVAWLNLYGDTVTANVVFDGSAYGSSNARAHRRMGYVRLSGAITRQAADRDFSTTFQTVGTLTGSVRPAHEVAAPVLLNAGQLLQGRITTAGDIQARSMTGTQRWHTNQSMDISGFGAFPAAAFP